MRTGIVFGVITAAILLCGADANPQADVQPTNDLPNPYQSIALWGKLPEGSGAP